MRRAQDLWRIQYDINRYLAAQGDRVPVHSLEEIIRSRRFHPSVQLRLQQAQEGTENGPETAACQAEAAYRAQVRTRYENDGRRELDALVYPTWSNPPRLIGDLNTPHGDNSQFFSPTTGLPRHHRSNGLHADVLPGGITFFGRAWNEATLIRPPTPTSSSRHRHAPAAPAINEPGSWVHGFMRFKVGSKFNVRFSVRFWFTQP